VLGLLASVLVTTAAWAAPGQNPLDAVRSAMANADYGAAVTAARAFILRTDDQAAKTEAMVLLADALRKKADWTAAAKAYADLKDRFEKGADSAIRYEATAEVVQACHDGVYPPLASSSTPGGSAKPLTVADDDALARALAHLGEARARKLDTRAEGLKRAATPQEAATLFAEIIEGYRQAHVLAPSLPRTHELEAAKAAGLRLESLSDEALPKLRARMTELQETIGQRATVNNQQKKELADCEARCIAMAESEDAFRETLKKVTERRDPDLVRLGAESLKRNREYGHIAQVCRRIRTRPALN
jgi:hypothetical protein